MKKTINLNCSCGCQQAFELCFDPNTDAIYISTLVSCFYERQHIIRKTILRRIKIAWAILRGKEYMFHDIVLTGFQWDEFVESVNDIDFERKKAKQNV